MVHKQIDKGGGRNKDNNSTHTVRRKRGKQQKEVYIYTSIYMTQQNFTVIYLLVSSKEAALGQVISMM